MPDQTAQTGKCRQVDFITGYLKVRLNMPDLGVKIPMRINSAFGGSVLPVVNRMAAVSSFCVATGGKGCHGLSRRFSGSGLPRTNGSPR